MIRITDCVKEEALESEDRRPGKKKEKINISNTQWQKHTIFCCLQSIMAEIHIISYSPATVNYKITTGVQGCLSGESFRLP